MTRTIFIFVYFRCLLKLQKVRKGILGLQFKKTPQNGGRVWEIALAFKVTTHLSLAYFITGYFFG